MTRPTKSALDMLKAPASVSTLQLTNTSLLTNKYKLSDGVHVIAGVASTIPCAVAYA